MLGIVGVWPPKHGEIIKSEMSNGRRTKLLLSVVEFTYDWLRFEGYLGNVGIMQRIADKLAASYKKCPRDIYVINSHPRPGNPVTKLPFLKRINPFGANTDLFEVYETRATKPDRKPSDGADRSKCCLVPVDIFSGDLAASATMPVET